MSYKRPVNCLKFSYLALCLLILQPVFAQYSFSAVDDWIKQNQKMLGGDVITLVYKDGKLIYKNELNKEFTGRTQTPIAGASQWLTAALAMQFVEEGKISLDDPVTKYIPIFTNYSKRYITIRNCLAHTTGIHAEVPGLKAMLLQKTKFKTLEEAADAFAKREIERNPGEMFFYSNIGPSIVGRILEIVSKKPFDRIVAEKLLRPLRMRQTNFYIDFDKAIDPAAGALSTANDYINFLSMLVNKGMFEGKRILSEKSIAEMQKLQTGNAVVKYTPPGAAGFDFGLGLWMLDKDAGGAGTVVSGSPGIFGTFPWVNYCRGYAAMVFIKEPKDDLPKDFYRPLVEIIDGQIQSNCK